MQEKYITISLALLINIITDFHTRTTQRLLRGIRIHTRKLVFIFTIHARDFISHWDNHMEHGQIPQRLLPIRVLLPQSLRLNCSCRKLHDGCCITRSQFPYGNSNRSRSHCKNLNTTFFFLLNHCTSLSIWIKSLKITLLC